MRGFHALLLPLLLIPFAAPQAQPGTPAGRWQTLDEDTGEVQSIIEIYRDGDSFAGKIAEILTGNSTARCTECSGKLKNKPILGLVIIEDLKPVAGKPGNWDSGTILDPQRGSDYKLSAWFEAGSPDVLFIRGKHWTGIYRTKEWIRAD